MITRGGGDESVTALQHVYDQRNSQSEAISECRSLGAQQTQQQEQQGQQQSQQQTQQQEQQGQQQSQHLQSQAQHNQPPQQQPPEPGVRYGNIRMDSDVPADINEHVRLNRADRTQLVEIVLNIDSEEAFNSLSECSQGCNRRCVRATDPYCVHGCHCVYVHTYQVLSPCRRSFQLSLIKSART